MAKHRTKQQKIKAQQGRHASVGPSSLRSDASGVRPAGQVGAVSPLVSTPVRSHQAVSNGQPAVPIPPTTKTLLRVDETYLRSDLRRSVVVSVVLLAVLIGISWLVRYNGLATLQSLFTR